MARPITPDSEHLWPWRIEDNPNVQDAMPEFGWEPNKLAAIFQSRYNQNRTDVEHNTWLKQIEMDLDLQDYSDSTFVLSDKVKAYIEVNLVHGIYKYLAQDEGLRKYLGTGFAGDVNVDVKAGNRLLITVSGPQWLRFYFTGWRTYRVEAKPHEPGAHDSRGMLVFYNNAGDKIVTRSVVIPGHPPGLYIERAIEDLIKPTQQVARLEIDRDNEYWEEEQEALSYQAEEQMRWAEQEARNEKERLRELRTEIRNYDPIAALDVDSIERDIDSTLHSLKTSMIEARYLIKNTAEQNTRRAVIAYNDAVERYFAAYIIAARTTGASQEEAQQQAKQEAASLLPKRSTLGRVKRVKQQLKERGII